jgi:hypothetical protein
MTRILAGAALAALAFCLQAAEPAWVTRSNGNAKLLLQVFAKYAPEGAGNLGVDGLDEEITDLARDPYEPFRSDTRAALTELEARLGTETDPKVRQDLEILITAAQDNLRSGELNRKYFFPFTDVTRNVFGVVRQTLDPRIPAARQAKLLVRLDKYAGVAPGYRPFTELAKERTLERTRRRPEPLAPSSAPGRAGDHRRPSAARRHSRPAREKRPEGVGGDRGQARPQPGRLQRLAQVRTYLPRARRPPPAARGVRR